MSACMSFLSLSAFWTRAQTTTNQGATTIKVRKGEKQEHCENWSVSRLAAAHIVRPMYNKTAVDSHFVKIPLDCYILQYFLT